MYQEKTKKYIDGEAYDNRSKSSLLEKYVLNLWQPFLKNKITDLSGDKIVVDLGCGTGEYLLAAKKARKIYAIDGSEPMLKVCREKLKDFNQVEVTKSLVEDFKMPGNESSGLVITIGVWEYVDSLKLISKIKEITKQGSKVMVVFPNIYNDLNWMRSIVRGKAVALRPGFISNLFYDNFTLLDMASFGAVSWVPNKIQILALPVWKFCDWLWSPFQKFLPLGVNVYYLFERK